MAKIDSSSLARQLEDGFIICPIDGKEFMPRDVLEMVISKEHIKGAMKIKNGVCVKVKLKKPSELPEKVVNQAIRIFAILVLMEKVDAMQGLIDEGLTDEHLPLKRHPDYPKNSALLSHDDSKTFQFTHWNANSMSDFIKYKQWPFLAPIIGTTGQVIEVDRNCPLPFKDGEPLGNGAAGIVIKANLHPAHQRGFEVSDILFDFDFRDTKQSSWMRLISKSQ